MNLDDVFSLLATLIAIWFMAPRVFHSADALMARRRLVDIVAAPSPQPSSNISNAPKEVPSRANTDQLALFAGFFDSVARSLRSSTSSHESLIIAIQKQHFTHSCWAVLCTDLTATTPVVVALKNAIHNATHDSSTDDLYCLELIIAATVNGAIIPAAVDQASGVLRAMSQCRADLIVAAAHSRFSAKILTNIPFVLIGIGLVFSSTFRSSFTTAPVITLFLIGTALNRFGRHVIEHTIRKTLLTREHMLADITDHLCVSLRGGLTLVHACERLAEINNSPATQSIRTAIRSGQPFETALAGLEQHFGLSGRIVADVLVEADRDGLPILPTVLRLSVDARSERRRQNDIAIRQLPTRLTIPLVLFVLPSFLILTIAPLITASLGQLNVSLPSLSPST